MVRILLATSVLMVGFVVPSSAAEYWPMDDGLTWSYLHSAGHEYDVTMSCFDGGCGRGQTIAAPTYTLGDYVWYNLNADGDVVVCGTQYWDSRQLDPVMFTYDPPLLFLDLPLTVGKIWFSSATGSAMVRGEVLRAETLTVGAGTFDVMVVRVTDLMLPTRISGDYYLSRTVGAVRNGVHDLASFSGAVGVDTESWGGIKALFR